MARNKIANEQYDDLIQTSKTLLTHVLNNCCSCNHQGEESKYHNHECMVNILNIREHEQIIAKAEGGK